MHHEEPSDEKMLDYGTVVPSQILEATLLVTFKTGLDKTLNRTLLDIT